MATTQARQWRELPNGHYETDYKGYGKWSLHRWAWEFLCRNEEFIEACHKLTEENLTAPSGTEGSPRMRIARQFHLDRFKHCNEPYDAGEEPSFNNVTDWRCEEDQRGRVVKTSIHRGEVLIRFNPRAALRSSNALSAQLAMAETVLKEHARMLAQLHNMKLPRNSARLGDSSERICWLRMLDADRHRRARNPAAQSGDKIWTRGDIFLNLFPTKAKDMSRDDRAEAFKSAIRTPIEVTQRTYLEMAIKGQKRSASRTMPINETSEQ